MFGWKEKAMNRRTAEVSGAYNGGRNLLTHGLMAGTRLASNLGWRAIEALAVGDLVLTFDNGMQEIVEIQRAFMWVDAPDSAEALWPVFIPAGALDNRTDLTLLADQGVLVESDAAADIYGDPFAVVPAATLVGMRGITRQRPMQQVELIAIYFAEDQVIYAEGGALIHCMQNRASLDKFLEAPASSYDVLSHKDAEFLVECLIFDEQMRPASGWADGQMHSSC
ncbi:MAG: Hint domain-containing protein [Sulfitobacter sp.]